MTETFMYLAIAEGKKAEKKGEIPIGAVIVKNGKVIAKAYNRREKDKSATAHAEILAIKKACKRLKDWRLNGCEIYVTLEPCLMCLGAILNARIDKLCFGAYDDKRGNLSAENLKSSAENGLNHNLLVEGGVLIGECQKLLADFFAARRQFERLKR